MQRSALSGSAAPVAIAVARDFGGHAQVHLPQICFLALRCGLRRLLAAQHTTPQVRLPRSVEAGLVQAEWRTQSADDLLACGAAQGARDRDLLEVVRRCETDTSTQLAWLKTRSKQAAPQALVVA